MLSDLCEQEEHGACFEDELDGCRCACHPDPPDCPAAVHDSQLNTSGGGRAQDARTGAPLPASAPPASIPPRDASAGKPLPGPTPGTPGRGTSSSAAADLALAAADQSPRPGRSQRGAGTGPGSPMEACTAVPGGVVRPGRAVDGTARPGQDARTWTLELPPGLPVLSLNGREHWAARHRKNAALRGAAWALAKQARIPRLERVSIVAEYQPPDRRRRDPDNIAASAKAAIDGFRVAGALPEDDSRHVVEVTCRIGKRYPKGRLVLTITEVAAATGSDAA